MENVVIYHYVIEGTGHIMGHKSEIRKFKQSGCVSKIGGIKTTVEYNEIHGSILNSLVKKFDREKCTITDHVLLTLERL